MATENATEVAQLAAELAELRKENLALSQQVKRWVKAEGKLYEYQQTLDAQLREYRGLYELSKSLASSIDIGRVFRETVSYVVENLEYERAVFLQRTEPSGAYRVQSFAGYYEPQEKERIAGLVLEVDDGLLAPLMAGREYVICGEFCREPNCARHRSVLLMDEYFIYPLATLSPPHALLVVGNASARAHFYRRVDETCGTLLCMGNLVGLVSALIENHVLYGKMQKALEALRESQQKYRQLNELLEERIRETVNELRQKDRMLILQGRQAVMGEMLSNIAHQWRQPLNMLGLLAQDLQLTQRKTGLSAEFIDANVNKTLEIIGQMSRTIDDFRYFFRPESEKVKFRVAETIEKTLAMLQGSFEMHGIRTSVTRQGDPVVKGYPSEFIQVLLNIMINARDALTARKVSEPEITVSLSGHDGTTVVSITDNAGGIPEEIIDKVFEPYFSTKGPQQGTGIGLYMCKTIVEKNMKGRLMVRNLEKGAEFRIEIG